VAATFVYLFAKAADLTVHVGAEGTDWVAASYRHFHESN
jgi:hypothetical protein